MTRKLADAMQQLGVGKEMEIVFFGGPAPVQIYIRLEERTDDVPGGPQLKFTVIPPHSKDMPSELTWRLESDGVADDRSLDLG